MEVNQIREYLEAEEQRAFSGWDFSYLDGRWEGELEPWDYKQIVESYRTPEMNLLDMGTGDGEFILSLKHPYELTSVTEGYGPNYRLCRDKLTPIGINVCYVDDDNLLDFPNECFDIVLNRHASFSSSEVQRVLRSRGFFITQQVGGENDADISRKLISNYQSLYPYHDLKNSLALLKELNFDIINAQESFTPVRFFDLGALVYFAKIIEWEFPGFSVNNCFDQLIYLHDE